MIWSNPFRAVTLTDCRGRLLGIILVGISALGLASQGLAQRLSSGGSNSQAPNTSSVPHINAIYNYGVLDPVAERIRAQGQYLESVGNFLRQVAEAQLILEEVERKRIENRIKRVEAFYEARRIHWQGMEDYWQSLEDARDRRVESKLNIIERKTELMMNKPATPAEAAGGHLLNEFLDRLEMSNIVELLESSSQPYGLPPNTNRDLRICMGTGHNKSKVQFRQPEDPFASDVPRALKKSPFRELTAEFLAIRKKMVSTIRGHDRVKDEDFDQAMLRIDELGRLVDKEIKLRKPYSNRDPKYIARRSCEKFLLEQTRQLGLLGVIDGFPEPFRGNTVQDLVVYMKQSGYRFDKADTGGENTYLALYNSLRDLFRDISNQF